jgi:hypothetical protein
MKPSKTLEKGTNTQSKLNRFSRLDIKNKNPNYEYCFCSRKEVEQGGGTDQYGFAPVAHGNSDGEDWAIPLGGGKNNKQKILQDTILCRRRKEVGDIFRAQENVKYNSQKNLIKQAAPNAQAKLRQLDPKATVTDQISGVEFTQKVGPNEASGG